MQIDILHGFRPYSESHIDQSSHLKERSQDGESLEIILYEEKLRLK